ncbi:MAG TPA: hypothetical protein DEO32_02015 [Ruminococcaceae bacterium]|nr:hypothetical protein [Oscillospiraceae bacterium]
MKKFMKLSALVLALTFAVFAFASCKGNNSSGSTAASSEAKSSEVQSSATEAVKADVDYSKPDLVINDGDFAAMEAFLKDWGENKWDDKVIKITGISARRMSNCTIMENDANGNGRGCSYEIIDGKFPDDYPADDAKVTVTGVLKLNKDTLARVLEVPADKVEAVK